MLKYVALFLLGIFFTAGSSSELPSYAKIYPGGRVISTQDAGSSHVVDYVTDASEDEVVQFYKAQGAANQLIRTMDNTMGGSGQHALAFQRKLSTNSAGFSVTIGRKGSQTLVTLTYQ